MAFSTQKKTRPTAGQFASCLAVQLILSNDPVLSPTSRSKVPNTFPFRAGDIFIQHYTPFGVPASGVSVESEDGPKNYSRKLLEKRTTEGQFED
jgi:hypothetical protein